MALLCDFQVLEIAGLRLDQPLTGCGVLHAQATRWASEARLIALDRLMQQGLDRGVDLVVWHSEILSEESSSGRAPWLLGRWIHRYAQAGIPVIWIEASHNQWMQRFVSTPSMLHRLIPGDVDRVVTHAGDVQIQVGQISADDMWGDRVHASIGFVADRIPLSELSQCDLVLTGRRSASDRVDDFFASTQATASEPLAAIHTLRVDRANACEIVEVCPVRILSLTCGLGGNVTAEQLSHCLADEIDSAVRRELTNHPQTQLLLVDVQVTGHGTVWATLWNEEQRDALVMDLNRLTTSTVTQVRQVTPIGDGGESASDGLYSALLSSIWQEMIAPQSPGVRSVTDIAQELQVFGEGAKYPTIIPSHELGPEVRQACQQMLRAAS